MAYIPGPTFLENNRIDGWFYLPISSAFKMKTKTGVSWKIKKP